MKEGKVYNQDHIPTSEKICYGLGGFMDGGAVAMMSCVMLKYMTTMGVAMAMASTIMMLAKIWDAITDPLMGFISDNTRGKYGRRKPYIFFGGVSVIIAIFLVFLPIRSWGVSAQGFVPYILIMYLFWNTCSTLSQVPYTSMSSDISPAFKERNNANTVKLVFVAAASGLAYVLPLVFVEALINKDGYMFMSNISPTHFWLLMSIVFGTLFGGGLIICGLFTKERVHDNSPKEKFNFKKFVMNYAKPYKNKSYRWHIAMYASAFMCMDMISALAVYYATDVWHGYKLFGMNMSSLLIIAPLMVAAFIMFPLVRYVMDKKHKAFAFRMGLPFYILGGILLAVMDPSWTPPIMVPIVAFIMGLGFGGAQMMPWIIFPDTVDVEELASGTHPTGTYSGMMTLARKIAGALGVGLVGWVIGLAGYQENTTGDATVYIEQTPAALMSIKLTLGIAIVIFMSISLYASFKYTVTTKKLIRIRYFIDKNKAGEPLTEEEIAEKEALIKDLYGDKEPVEFNTEPLTGLTGALCKSMGIEAPNNSEGVAQDLVDYIMSQTNGEKIDRVVMYNPDAIGMWIYQKYYDKFESFRSNAPYEQKFITVFPPKTPVCFGSMYTGASPSIHGIQRYEKPVIKIDTIFDALIRAGKKPCIIAVKGSSLSKIFNERDMDYYFEAYDKEVVDKALEIIKEDKYDFIVIYNQEYDDAMHRTHPKSLWSKGAIKRYNESFARIGAQVRESLGGHNTLLGCGPDHGVHREWYLLGQHGKNIPKDMNIVHWYGVYPKQK